jgi:hypothetical protein
MKKIFPIMILLLFVFATVQAQEMKTGGYKPSSYYTFSWNTAFPIGDFNKWVSQPSPAGFDFGGRYIIRKGVTVGFNVGWQRVTKMYTGETYTIPEKGIAITANNYRFTWMVPIQAVIAYHLIPDKIISPYISLGIGTDYMEHHLMIQEYDIYSTSWDFSLTPEIGILAKFGNYSRWGGILAFNYKWTTNHIDFMQKTTKDLQMLNIKLGISLIIR